MSQNSNARTEAARLKRKQKFEAKKRANVTHTSTLMTINRHRDNKTDENNNNNEIDNKNDIDNERETTVDIISEFKF